MQLLSILSALLLSVIQLVPSDFPDKLPTGGDIEARFVRMGSYDVAHLEENVDEDFRTVHVYYPDIAEGSDEKFPVVVMANGTFAPASTYPVLFRHLASWGFIVVGNEAWMSGLGVDAVKSLQHLLSLNETPGSVLYGKVDLDNMGLFGHSQGGAGVFNAIAHDSGLAFKTIVSLSPANQWLSSCLNWGYEVTGVTVPVLLVSGMKGPFETMVVAPLDKVISIYDQIDAPKVMMRRKDAFHANMLYRAEGYVTAWMMWQLKNDRYASGAFTGDAPEILSNPLYQDQRIDLPPSPCPEGPLPECQ